MIVDAEKDGVARLATKNDSRITPVGKVIRATRIDELPQLLNIFKGDMSVVGPRPERPEIAKEYEESIPEFGLPSESKGRPYRLRPDLRKVQHDRIRQVEAGSDVHRELFDFRGSEADSCNLLRLSSQRRAQKGSRKDRRSA
mgnify:CR=1 FL=1